MRKKIFGFTGLVTLGLVALFAFDAKATDWYEFEDRKDAIVFGSDGQPHVIACHDLATTNCFIDLDEVE